MNIKGKIFIILIVFTTLIMNCGGDGSIDQISTEEANGDKYQVAFATALNEKNEPVDNLQEISMYEETVYMHISWWFLTPGNEYHYILNCYNNFNSELIFTNEINFFPDDASHYTWTWFKPNKFIAHIPGRWKFEIFLNEDKMLERLISIINNNIIIDNERHIITYEVSEENIIFNFEEIGENNTNNSNRVGIYVDVNKNVIIDKDYDLYYGSCPTYLGSYNSVRPCGYFESNATRSYSIKSTLNYEIEHSVWEYEIPIIELTSGGNTAHMLFKFYNDIDGYTTYPKGNIYPDSVYIDFAETIKIKW